MGGPLLISPPAGMQRGGGGTTPEMASLGAERPSVDHRDGCRGFTGPFPPPLWMSNMKLLSRILTDSFADVPAGPRPAHRPVQAAPHYGHFSTCASERCPGSWNV